MAIVLFISSVFFSKQIPISSPFAIAGVLILVFVAGMTNPRKKILMLTDFIVAVGTFIIFGGELVASHGDVSKILFWASMILSVLSLFAIYLSTLVLRDEWTPKE